METKVSSIVLYYPRQELYHTVFQMGEGTEKRQEQHTSLNGFPLSVIPRVPIDYFYFTGRAQRHDHVQLNQKLKRQILARLGGTVIGRLNLQSRFSSQTDSLTESNLSTY